MALKKLPNDIQHLLCASPQINSHKRAIEELVYNSLDASSTSIAIRVHIEEDTIQVVDNGHGITKPNFEPLGKRYMTSKYVDMNTLKSIPNKYGFRGETLANIIKISHIVKIISRHETGEETRVKTFCNGKEKEIIELTTRPSKGTTIEVKGFLYNLSIQKKASDSINVIQDIKTFLEQLSLVNNHISLSLRDDSKNEIVFKMHKKRDIYQTLSSLFGIDKPDLQELKVEKNQYKVTGLIGKTDKEIGRRWIFLNEKFVNNSKLHKIINDTMANSVCRDEGNRRAKLKTFKDDADFTLLKKKPFYFIFIACPYIDYDVSYTPKNSVLEFKDWEQIKKLLEKLIKFYTGDMDLKEIKKPDTKLINVEQEEKTRFEVKTIMEKFLGQNSKKFGVSQIQKGIKGKRIKRKKKRKPIDKSVSKIEIPKNNNVYTKFDDKSNEIGLNAVETHFVSNNINSICELNNKKKSIAVRETKPSKPSDIHQYTATTNYNIKDGSQHSHYTKKSVSHKMIVKKTKQCKTAITENENLNHKSNLIEDGGIKNVNGNKDTLNERFENPTESLKFRCDIIARKAKYLLECRKDRLREMIVKQTKEHDSKANNNKIVPVHKKVSKIYNHNNTPILPKFYTRLNIHKDSWNKAQERPYKTTYDLVHTILNSTPNRNTQFERVCSPFEVCKTHFKPNNNIMAFDTNTSNIQYVSQLTFESHNYNNYKDNQRATAKITQKFNKKVLNKHFITGESRDNFKLPINNRTKTHNPPYNRYFNTKKIFNKKTMNFNIGNSIKDNRYEETYMIEFSENNNPKMNDGSKLNLISPSNFTNHEENRVGTSNNFDTIRYYETNCNIGNTCTVVSSVMLENSIPVFLNLNQSTNFGWHEHRRKYTLECFEDTINNGKDNLNSNTFVNNEIDGNNESVFVFSSKSQRSNAEVIFDTNIEPLNICETILSTHDSDERVLNNRESNYLNNNEVIDNTLKDIEECINYPYYEKEELNINLNEEPNNSAIIEGLNTCVYLEKSDNTRDCQTIEINRKEHLEIRDEVSHHFDMTHSNNLQISQLMNQNNSNNENIKNINYNENTILNLNVSNAIEKDYFHLKNRLNFIPKGFSPIFANCNNKGTCDYNPENDYYEDNIYNNFVNDVQINSEVFEPRIENMKCHTNKDIEKVSKKLDKDNASLIFNGQSLKEAKVLAQVDGKFIAAIMKSKCNVQDEISEFLILFDQHAVHERIRLEKNLLDYIDDGKWKSIPLDNISLKIVKDEVLYLHNYMDKFHKFGLQWTFLSNCEISINTVPEAILGKNPRPVDRIIKAVKNLISEEINMIRLQKGCVSLYPKSIMDLVFSEACRYAIKFGDKLSYKNCTKLLSALSKCKTPFQCAHGRPVMAVLMDYKCENHKYEINFKALKKFAENSSNNNKLK